MNKLIVFGIIGVIVLGGGFFLLNAYNHKQGNNNSYPDYKNLSYKNKALVEQMDSVEFGKPVTVAIDQSITFSDGLRISLLEIQDSRCKPDVVCIWAGELAPLLRVVNGRVGETPQTIRLGTRTKKTITQGGYVFTLNAATEKTATLSVTIQ